MIIVMIIMIILIIVIILEIITRYCMLYHGFVFKMYSLLCLGVIVYVSLICITVCVSAYVSWYMYLCICFILHVNKFNFYALSKNLLTAFLTEYRNIRVCLRSCFQNCYQSCIIIWYVAPSYLYNKVATGDCKLCVKIAFVYKNSSSINPLQQKQVLCCLFHSFY